jgi:hypothetical protein
MATDPLPVREKESKRRERDAAKPTTRFMQDYTRALSERLVADITEKLHGTAVSGILADDRQLLARLRLLEGPPDKAAIIDELRAGLTKVLEAARPEAVLTPDNEEAARILAQIDEELPAEEARATRLLQVYGLV